MAAKVLFIVFAVTKLWGAYIRSSEQGLGRSSPHFCWGGAESLRSLRREEVHYAGSVLVAQREPTHKPVLTALPHTGIANGVWVLWDGFKNGPAEWLWNHMSISHGNEFEHRRTLPRFWSPFDVTDQTAHPICITLKFFIGKSCGYGEILNYPRLANSRFWPWHLSLRGMKHSVGLVAHLNSSFEEFHQPRVYFHVVSQEFIVVTFWFWCFFFKHI